MPPLGVETLAIAMLRAARLEDGCERLARRTGLTDRTLRNIVNGRSRPTLETVYILLDTKRIPLEAWRQADVEVIGRWKTSRIRKSSSGES